MRASPNPGRGPWRRRDFAAGLRPRALGLKFDVPPDAVVEIATDDIASATALLSVPIGSTQAYDVVVFVAHRIPSGPDGATDQATFVFALEAFLVAGRGVVMGYQPGEYQPQALDGLAGNNFQILANAILYAAAGDPRAVPLSSAPLHILLVLGLMVTVGWFFRRDRLVGQPR